MSITMVESCTIYILFHSFSLTLFLHSAFFSRFEMNQIWFDRIRLTLFGISLGTIYNEHHLADSQFVFLYVDEYCVKKICIQQPGQDMMINVADLIEESEDKKLMFCSEKKCVCLQFHWCLEILWYSFELKCFAGQRIQILIQMAFVFTFHATDAINYSRLTCNRSDSEQIRKSD